MTKIHRIRLEYHLNVWLIENEGRWIVVDTGKRRTIGQLMAGLEAVGCRARDIALIVISHAHYDHAGGLDALKRASGAPAACHREDESVLRAGGFMISDGLNALGRFKAFVARCLMPRRMFAFDPVEPDILVDEELRLDDLGFPAALLHTPGHSNGSISLLTDDGALFAGDLAITQPLPGMWRHMPIYGSSIGELKKTWRAMIDRGARHVYPGHGPDFPVSELERYL